MAYRYRSTFEVKYGHMREVIESIEEMKAVAKSRGWADQTYWAGTVGQSNVIVQEMEFPTLEAFNRESRAVLTDPEYMKLVRAQSENIVQGSARDELLEPVFQMA